MTNKTKRKLFAAISIAAAVSIAVPCYANSIQEEIDQVTAETEEAQITLIDAREQIAQLEAQKDNMEAYLGELDRQIEDLNNSIQSVKEKCEVKKQEIAETEAELSAAREEEKKQYEEMKLRIRFIYEETVSTGMLETILSAGSFSDMLNRTEEISQINRYDRDMLDEYQATVESINAKEQDLQKEYDELNSLQQTLVQQQGEVEVIYQAAYEQMQGCIAELAAYENEQQELIQKIAAGSERLGQLMQIQAEEAAAAQAAAEAAAAQANALAAQNMQYESYNDSYSASSASEGGNSESRTVSSSSSSYESSESSSVSSSSSEASGGMSYLGNFTLTAYCSCEKCCGKWAAYGAITASGARCQEGVTVAMGGVPFGTQLSINGHVYTVQDRGTPYGHVDIYFSSHSAASAFGLKHADVYKVN